MVRGTLHTQNAESASGGRDARLRLNGVTKRYGRLHALDGVTLSVHSGEIVAVVGENGAGKSTLVGCIAGDVAIDEGRIERPSGLPGSAVPPVAVVWQDLGLCDDLDVVANIFLGRERGRGLLAEAHMAADARSALDQIGSQLADVRARADTLSRGGRQEVALARALAVDSDVLVLDEPTASLSVQRRAAVVRVLGELRDAGRAILLVSHDLDEVFALADRIVVLRHGRIVADVSPAEVHTDDVAALMSGIETESLARRQLNRLKSLVEQLSAADPAASLPLVVSATAAALDHDMLCVHLLDKTPGGTALRRTAAIGLPPQLADSTSEVQLGSAGGPVGTAAELGHVVIVDDVRDDPAWCGYLDAAIAAGVRSAWSAPIVGTSGVLGTITGFGTSAGRLDSDRAELVSLYAGHAATAIERERLIEEVSRRNQVLESLRGMLETLAGPERVDGGLSAALLALCRGLGARRVGMLLSGVPEGAGRPRWVSIDVTGSPGDDLRRVADDALADVDQPKRVAGGLAVAGLPLPSGRGVLVSQWDDPGQPGRDAVELLDDARRSLALALEGEGLERARSEAAAARRSQQLQRELLQQLSHELRTPLTAIRGYSSTLQQPDLTWDAESTDRFLTAITTESARMERLVGDLLDSSAIESGVLRLRRDWTDLAGLLVGAVVGLLHATMVTRIGVPSFVVTLAGLLTWQGAMLLVLGDTGTVNVTDPHLEAITATFLPKQLGWALAAAFVGVATAAIVLRGRQDVASALRTWPWVAAGAGVTVAVTVFNADRGVPLAVVLFLLLLAGGDVVMRRTRLGRHAIAIGSDASAARRAGIGVDRIRMAVFALASVLAVTGGILAASRLLAATSRRVART